MDLRFGLDLVPVASIAASVEADPDYLERTFTSSEIAGSRRGSRVDPRRLAERFAVKAATLKVLPVTDDEVDIRSIELVVDRESDRLAVAVHGRAAELAAASGITRLAVSVTSDDRLAAAVVAASVGPIEA